jgi:hypothetical protein
MMPNISSPASPASKMTEPAGTSRVSMAPLNTPAIFMASRFWRGPM